MARRDIGRPRSFSDRLRARLLGEGYLGPEPPPAPVIEPAPAPRVVSSKRAPLFAEPHYMLLALGFGVVAFLAAARWLEHRQGRPEAPPEVPKI